MKDTRLWTVIEVAHWLKVEPGAIRRWLRRGELRGMKLPGGDWRIRAEDLDMLLKPPGASGDIFEA